MQISRNDSSNDWSQAVAPAIQLCDHTMIVGTMLLRNSKSLKDNCNNRDCDGGRLQSMLLVFVRLMKLDEKVSGVFEFLSSQHCLLHSAVGRGSPCLKNNSIALSAANLIWFEKTICDWRYVGTYSHKCCHKQQLHSSNWIRLFFQSGSFTGHVTQRPILSPLVNIGRWI